MYSASFVMLHGDNVQMLRISTRFRPPWPKGLQEPRIDQEDNRKTRAGEERTFGEKCL